MPLQRCFSLHNVAISSTTEINNEDTRAKVITELMDNVVYTKEVMDAIKQNGNIRASTSCCMMIEDKAKGLKTMDNMMDICSGSNIKRHLITF